MGFAFPRTLRITTAREYRDSLDTKTRINLKGLIGIAKRNHLPNPRLGLIIAKKEIPLAVKRNRIKRQLRESFRFNQSKISGFDVIIIIKKPCGLLNQKQIRELSDKLWARLNSSGDG